MPDPPNDPLLGAFVLCVWLLGVSTWLYLLSNWRRGPFLRYEPRLPVPWGPAASMLAVLFVVLAFATAFSGGSSGAKDAELAPNASESVVQLVGAMIPQLVVVGVFLFVIAVTSKPTARDLGLPKSAGALGRDIFVGVVASFAAIAPVDTILALLKFALHEQEQMSQHELVKMITSGEPNVPLLVVASLAAVVVAPICEEITFRLLLQGWLEKWEDGVLGWRRETTNTEDESAVGNDELPIPDSVDRDLPDYEHSSCDNHQSSLPAEPPRRGVAGLPYGWLPIFVSSLLFALAHFGYGPEPVPLFFLALILGYLYQRTHRILPCIIVHAMFNAFTMIILWRMVLSNAK